MKKTYKKWTLKERRVLIAAIKKNPNNLTKAFKEVAKKLDRSFASVTGQWYGDLKHKETVFVTVSPKKTYSNSKNETKQTVSKRTNFWKIIKNLFK